MTRIFESVATIRKMVRLTSLVLLASLSLAALDAETTQAASRRTPDSVAGIRLEMSRADVRRRLGKIGHLVREERKRQEVWAVERDRRFASVLVGYDADYKVRYVTAIMRDEGERMRYSEIADVKTARPENTINSYMYTWEIKPRGRKPGYFLIAMGRDPQYLHSFSIKKKPGKEID